MSDYPEIVWLVEAEDGLQEARVGGNGVEYIRTSEHDAEVERLREALQAMFDCYEGVYDMAVPALHRSEDAKQADALARAALAGEGTEDE